MNSFKKTLIIGSGNITFKKLIIITLFLLSILMISSASATSNTTNYEITENISPTTDTTQYDGTNTKILTTNKEMKHEQEIKDKNIKNKLKTEINNIYVNKSSENTIEDGTKLSPYKTINETLINELQTETIINIANGKYELDPINLNNNITIIGQNKYETILYTNSKNGLFNINTNSNLKLINLTIRDYNSTISPAITNNGQLTIENLFLQNATRNIANANGGFIYSTNKLIVLNCTFDDAFASYGACIYTNNGHTNIINSNFTNNEILNVGGAIYSKNSKTEVYNSIFMYNKAVSGAAIYNAFGNLTVNNTCFYKNDAQHFFGGAIYNTGRTIVNNSQFIENHAKIDGGAITNTNYFYSINCSYITNWANKNGGVIENIPVNEIEKGNIIIINNTFSENSADYGGVIINYNKYGTTIYGTINITNTRFIENNAYKGGVIYNEGILNIANSTSRDNLADEGNIIYMDSGYAKITNSNIRYTDIYCSNNNFNIESMDPKTIIIKDKHYQQNTDKNLTNSTKQDPNTDITHTNVNNNIPSSKITKKNIKIIAIKKTFKSKNKNKKYSIILKSGKKALKNIKVTLKIKRKTYKATTNKKGKAIFKITKLTKKGKYKATIKFAGNKNYKKVVKTVKIIIR